MRPVKQATINIPLNGLTFLHRNEKNGRAVCEIDIKLLDEANRPNMIDLMVAEAREEYKAGKTRGFTSTKELLEHLNS